MRFSYTQGLPGSGKSTWAIDQVSVDPENSARVNMDLFREMFHGRPQPLAQSRVCEERVVSARNAMIRHLMRAEVPHVISDDTNLHPSAPSLFAAFAREFGYQGVAKDFTHVPLDECISRDRLRSRQVGEIVIRRMHERYFEPGRRECR